MNRGQVVADLVKRFQITTNGLRFRIEQLEWRGHLWWRRQKWIPVCRCDWYGDQWLASFPVEYKTYDEAKHRLGQLIQETAAEICGWEPLGESHEPERT